MKKVAVYLSFKNKSENYINHILNETKKYCSDNKYNYTLYVDNIKNHLGLFERKELKRLKDDIQENKYSKVIIRDVTHLSKNTAYNMKFVNLLEDNNCKIESMDGMDLHLYKKIYDDFRKFKEGKVR